MIDVFVSYSTPDRELAGVVAAALAEQQLTVWWDRNLPAGMDLDSFIESKLASAARVVVLWSQASINSRWVKAEATFAADHNKLFPILIDDSTPPLSFRTIAATKLNDWIGLDGTVDYSRLASTLRPLLDTQSREKTQDIADLCVSDHLLDQIRQIWTILRGITTLQIEIRASRPLLSRERNNPLLFATSDSSAIELMTGSRIEGWLSADEAIDDAIQMIADHHAAFTIGVFEAFRSHLQSVDPGELEQRYSKSRKWFHRIAGRPNATNWRCYVENFDSDELSKSYISEIGEAYDAAIRDVRSARNRE